MAGRRDTELRPYGPVPEALCWIIGESVLEGVNGFIGVRLADDVLATLSGARGELLKDFSLSTDAYFRGTDPVFRVVVAAAVGGVKDFCDVILLNDLFSLRSVFELVEELLGFTDDTVATAAGTGTGGCLGIVACFPACMGRTEATLAGFAVIGDRIGSLFGSLETVVVIGTDICFELPLEVDRPE